MVAKVWTQTYTHTGEAQETKDGPLSRKAKVVVSRKGKEKSKKVE